MAVRLRVTRLGRFVVGSMAGLSALIGLSVAVARTGDNVACIILAEPVPFPNKMIIADLNTGRSTVDRRRGWTGGYGQTAPDRKHWAFLRSEGTSSSFYTRPINWDDYPPSSGKEVLIQAGIHETPDWNSPRRMRWSPDGSQVALAWTTNDDTAFLTVANADGTGSRSTPINVTSSVDTLHMQGWSSDGEYVAVFEREQITSRHYSFWRMPDLTAVNAAPVTFALAEWSPKGHVLAAIRRDASTQEFVIFSPEKGILRTAPLPYDENVMQLSWSPDGAYVAVYGFRKNCLTPGNCPDYSTFDIFTADGAALVTGIYSVPARLLSYVTTTSRFMVAAMWSGRSWLFLRESPVSVTPTLDLIALHVDERRYETIATDIVPNYAKEVFYVSDRQRQVYPIDQSVPLIPDGRRIVLPLQRGDKIDVVVADPDGRNRITLVEGADAILDRSRFPDRSMFWHNDDTAMVAWAEGKGIGRKLHLTWLAGDTLHEIGDGIEDVQLSNVWNSGDEWFGYTAVRNGKFNLEAANLKTGEHHSLLAGLDRVEMWTLNRQPKKPVAAVWRYDPGLARGNTSRLYLTSLSGQWTKQIAERAIASASWSPDGSRLAFLTRDPSKVQGLSLEVVTPDGTPLNHIDIRGPGLGRELYISGWTRCYPQ